MTSPRTRVLLVTPFPPRRDAGHGGARVMAETAVALAERFDVGLLALRAQGEGMVDDAVREHCQVVRLIERAPVGASPVAAWRERRRLLLAAQRLPGWAVGHAVAGAQRELVRLVADWRPDIVQLEFLVLAELARGLPRSGPPVVIVDHDARPSAGGSERAWRRLRLRAAAVADAFVVFTDTDRAVVEADVAGLPVEVIPPGLELPAAADGAVAGATVLFVGGYRHPPNVDAARRLVANVHPLVRSKVPDATLILAGPDPPPDLTGQGVIVAGMVPELADVLAGAAVVVAPLDRGGGMRVKVLEALASGKALVASSRALDGLELRDGEHVLVADGDAATADAIVRLLTDSELRGRLEFAGRAWAERALAWSTRVEAYDALYRRLLDERGRE